MRQVSPLQASPAPWPLVSIIAPVTRPNGDLTSLYRALSAELGEGFEFLFVFDGGQRRPDPGLVALARDDPRLRIFGFADSFGEAVALRAGIEQSRGEALVLLGEGRRPRSDEIRVLLDELAEGADFVMAGAPARNGWIPSVQRRLTGALERRLAGVHFGESSAGLRVVRREAALCVPLYGGAHRFFPAMVALEGYRVKTLPPPPTGDESPARSGIRGYLGAWFDLLTYLFVSRFMEKPLRFFGSLGLAVGGTGVVIAAVLAFQRLVYAQGIANRPMLLLGVLLIAVGVQIVGLGLVGEIIVSLRAPENPAYRVRRIV